MDGQQPLDVILSVLPAGIRAPLERARNSYAAVREITLRSGRPLCIECPGQRFYLTSSGVLTGDANHGDLVAVTAAEMQEVFLRLCDYSVYSRQDELIRGYLSAPCGVRVGLCGTAVVRDGAVTGLREVTTLSFRVPREVRGCAQELLTLIDAAQGVLVCGAPCSGKTTLIRDAARILSLQYRVSVIDERGELSASVSDGMGYDLGLCDVYAHMPKGDGVLAAVRSMSPDIIVCDELGDRQDASAVAYALRCGAAFVATVHAATLDDLLRRAMTRELLATGAFRFLVFLSDRSACGRIRRICEWRADDA